MPPEWLRCCGRTGGVLLNIAVVLVLVILNGVFSIFQIDRHLGPPMYALKVSGRPQDAAALALAEGPVYFISRFWGEAVASQFTASLSRGQAKSRSAAALPVSVKAKSAAPFRFSSAVSRTSAVPL